jgi:hypothetical protein
MNVIQSIFLKFRMIVARNGVPSLVVGTQFEKMCPWILILYALLLIFSPFVEVNWFKFYMLSKRGTLFQYLCILWSEMTISPDTWQTFGSFWLIFSQ